MIRSTAMLVRRCVSAIGYVLLSALLLPLGAATANAQAKSPCVQIGALQTPSSWKGTLYAHPGMLCWEALDQQQFDGVSQTKPQRNPACGTLTVSPPYLGWEYRVGTQPCTDTIFFTVSLINSNTVNVEYDVSVQPPGMPLPTPP